MPRSSFDAFIAASSAGAQSLGEQIDIADDAVRPAARVGHRLHPLDLVERAGGRPVGLYIDRARNAVRFGVGQIFADQVVAPQRLIGPEDARHHGPGEPRQIGLPPDVMMGVDDAGHAPLRSVLRRDQRPAEPHRIEAAAAHPVQRQRRFGRELPAGGSRAIAAAADRGPRRSTPRWRRSCAAAPDRSRASVSDRRR